MSDPVTYTATLPISRSTVERIAVLLHAHRRALRTRSGRRALGCFTQAVLFCRWMLHATRVRQLATDHHLSLATTYRYLAEVLDVLAEQAPGLRGALLAAKIAGYPYVMLDETLIPTDRCSAPGPTQGVDLWWSGKHHRPIDGTQRREQLRQRLHDSARRSPTVPINPAAPTTDQPSTGTSSPGADMSDYITLPAGLPAPEDDGAAAHLPGATVPTLRLPTSDGSSVDLAELVAPGLGRVVVYLYPLTGRPGVEVMSRVVV